MLFGINIAFWIGMGVIAALVITGCTVAWTLPPKKTADAVSVSGGKGPGTLKPTQA